MITNTSIELSKIDGSTPLVLVHRPGGAVRIGADSLRQSLGVGKSEFGKIWIAALRVVADPNALGVDRPEDGHSRATLLPSVCKVIVRSFLEHRDFRVVGRAESLMVALGPISVKAEKSEKLVRSSAIPNPNL